MQLQLYIENQRVELYEDETIEVNDSIRDVQQIDKLKTSFTRRFNVPASDVNNLIFKHFYNPTIVDGFDARRRIDAELRINGITYRRGKVVLDSVQMKNNQASSYRVIFFGDGVNFKLLFGEDQLDQLSKLQEQNHTYSRANVLNNGFQNGFTDGAVDTNPNPKIIYPFITHTKGYLYTNNVREIEDDTVGLDFRELKPAIRFDVIMEAIEDRYDIEFEGDILQEDRFKLLYMWMHRNNGNIQTVVEETLDIRRNQFTLTEGDNSWDANPLEVFKAENGAFRKYDFELNITPSGSGNYSIIVRNSLASGTLFTFNNLSGNQTINFTLEGNIRVNNVLGIPRFNLEILFIVSPNISSFDIEADVVRTFNNVFFDPNFGVELSNTIVTQGTYNATNLIPISQIDVDLQMPPMRVIDFLNGIFKMFNLLFLFDGQKIKLFTFNEWLQEDNIYDLTEQIDISDSTISRISPYSDILFKHSDNRTFFATNFTRLFAKEFGQLTFQTSPDFEGDRLNIETGFEIMLYERMLDPDGQAVNVGWGWSVTENKQPHFANPLIFYNQNTSIAPSITTLEGGPVVTIPKYNRPSNQVPTQPSQSILFGAENDYYTGDLLENSLFIDFWRQYLLNFFDRRVRKYTKKAILPIDFILTYQLNDKIKIGDYLYYINMLKTDLTTGEASLELINDVEQLR